MSTTYRQISQFNEDGYGTVTVLFVVSDEYNGLFATSGQIDVGIFALESGKKDLETEVGTQTTDEISFQILGQSAETTEDEDAVTFTLQAQSASTVRYCAVFLNPANVDAPVINEADFLGIVNQEMNAEDLQWSGAEWESNPDPLREWDCTAGVFYAESFDRIPLEDLIVGNSPDIPGIPASYESTEVADRVGYFHEATTHLEGRYASLTSINALLEQLKTNLETALANKGFGAFSITLANSPLGFKLAPLHHSYIGGDEKWIVVASQKNYNVGTKTDAVELELGTAAADKQIYGSYLLAKPDYIESTPGSNPDDYTFQNLESFTDLLYGVAVFCGCYLEYEWTSPTELSLTFSSKEAIKKHEVWIRDAERAELAVNPSDAAGKDAYYAESNGLAQDGFSTYYFNWGTSSYQRSLSKRDKSGDRLLMSVSSPFREVTNYNGGVMLPHNVVMKSSVGTFNLNNEAVNTKGITTAIYMQTLGIDEPNLSGQTIWAPAALVIANIDGQDVKFHSLADYVNYLNKRDVGYFEAEYTLEVPYLCSFRKSADGSHVDDDGGRGHWKNLANGCKLTLDGREFVVVGIERSYSRPHTKVRLHLWSRFAFSSPGAPAPADTEIDLATVNPPDTGKLHTASGAIESGDYVNVAVDGKVYKTKARHDYFDSPYGVAMNDAADGDLVYVQIEGIVENEDYNFYAGDMVFVRTNDSGLNISQTALAGTDNLTGEDMYLRVGHAVTATSFKLESPRKIVFQPEIPA